MVGIEGVDTRALTRHIRTAGAMKAVISTECLDEKELISKAQSSPGIIGRDLVQEVTCEAVYQWEGQRRDRCPLVTGLWCWTAALKGISCACLLTRDVRLPWFPLIPGRRRFWHCIPMDVVLSNGPGDPAAVPYVVAYGSGADRQAPPARHLSGPPDAGTCPGGKTYKLKFGHRGGNQPVKDLASGKVSITSQNHGFCVDMESLKTGEIELTHINLNDHTLEGMRHKTLPLFSVQYHPEASPGPHDASYLFQEFVSMMKRWTSA